MSFRLWRGSRSACASISSARFRHLATPVIASGPRFKNCIQCVQLSCGNIWSKENTRARKAQNGTSVHKNNIRRRIGSLHGRFGSKADMCSALGDIRFVPIVDIASSGSVRQKPQPCSRGFACDGAVKGQTKTTPRHVQLDSTPTVTFAAMLPLVIGIWSDCDHRCANS